MKTLASFVTAALVGILPASAAAAATPSFGITAPYTKVGGAAPLWNPSQMHVAVSGNDVYVAYGETTAAGDEEVLVGHSADGGLTWDTGTVVAHGPGVVPTGAVAVGPDPTSPGAKLVHVVYGVMNDMYGNGSIFYTHLRGGTWSAPVLVSGASTVAADTGAVAADPNGGVYIVYSATSTIRRSRSSDGGDSFFVLDGIVSAHGGSRPSVAVDTAGDEFVAWADNAGIWFARRNARAFDFGPAVYAGNGYKGGSPVLVALDASHLYIGYDWGMALDSYGIALSASTDGGASFTSHDVVVGQTGHVGLAVNSSGVLSLAYDANGILLQRSSNGGTSWTTPVPVDAAAGSEYPSLALVSGKLVVAYDKKPGQAVYLTAEK